MNRIIDALQKFQMENNFTQHQMANLLRISQPSYNNWVNGKTIIDPKYYPKIGELCKIDLSSLISLNSTISTTRRNMLDNGLKVNALELYEKFADHLQEHNQLLKNEIERYKEVINSKDELIKIQAETIDFLKAKD